MSETAAIAAVVLDLVRESGLGLLSGRLLVPASLLGNLARRALARAKPVEAVEVIPGDDEVRLHLMARVLGRTSRVQVRAEVAMLHLSAQGGMLRLRLLEPPAIAGRDGGKVRGVLGMLGAVSGAALATMGTDGVVAAVADLVGPPLSAREDLLEVDLGAIPALRELLSRPTPVGVVGDLVHVVGARFVPSGLEVALRVRPRVALDALALRLPSALRRRSTDVGRDPPLAAGGASASSLPANLDGPEPAS